MALPFALDGGGYFIFLSIYATLCSLYLHQVQCTEDPLDFDVSIMTTDRSMSSLLTWLPILLTVTMASTMLTARRRRRLWDPGRSHPMASLYPMAWIDVMESSPSLSMSVLLTWSLLFAVTMASTMLTAHLTPRRRTARWYPGISELRGYHDGTAGTCLVTVDRDVVGVCGRHIQLIVLQRWMISYVYQRPASRFLHRRSLPWIDQVPLLFHYSHPVLSRPTVPNIINNPVQRCRWCLL